MQSKLNEKLTLTVTVTEANKNERLVLKAIAQAKEDDSDRTLDEVEIEVPSKIEICSHCSGEGKHSKRFGAFSGERLEEARADEEFWEGYTSGAFDESCDRCDGAGRVRVPAENLPKWLAEVIEKDDEEEAGYRAEQLAELRAQYGTEVGPEWGD